MVFVAGQGPSEDIDKGKKKMKGLKDRITDHKKKGLKEGLKALIHSHLREGDSDTPDYLLAEFLMGCLEAFELAVNKRDGWYSLPHDMFDRKERRLKEEAKEDKGE